MHVSACTEFCDLPVSSTMFGADRFCALLGGFGRQLLVKEKRRETIGCLLCGEGSIPDSSAHVHGFVEKLELF
jgi:hypothetical protein